MMKSPHSASSSVSPASRGFTLIELLTVIAIIGILASILIPVVGRVRQSASKAHTISGLRQIGLATSVFASDNNGFFPGMYRTNANGQPDANFALGGGQGPYGNPGTRMSLQHPDHLGPYIDVQTFSVNGTNRLYTGLLDRPAWRYVGTGFLRAVSVRGFDGALRYPAGHQSGFMSMRLEQFDRDFDMARRWFLIEIDQTTPTVVDPNLRNAGWFNELPPESIHGGGWVALFFGGNVDYMNPGDPRLDNMSSPPRR